VEGREKERKIGNEWVSHSAVKLMRLRVTELSAILNKINIIKKLTHVHSSFYPPKSKIKIRL